MTDASAEYEAGDINQLAGGVDEDDELEEFDEGDDHDDLDGREGNRVQGAVATAVLTHLATSLADEPDAVVVESDVRGRRANFRVHVAQPDMGRVIGRRGRTAQAIRAIVAAAGAREGLTTSVDIAD